MTDYNKIYSVLVDIGGANESDRYSFVFAHEDFIPCREWRFCGHLGFGGKYRSYTNTVDCYIEDETPKRRDIIAQVNQALEKL